MHSRLRLTRRQILAFRRRVGGLDERMPEGAASLRRAAWAGLQDSMPRAALLTLHARVDGVEPSTWEDPSLAQLWGPRYSAYVVAERDFALFSLGRLPDDARGRLRAERTAERLHAHLGGARMTDREAGRALDLGNSIRYAATTGTVAIRWDGARAPTIWTVAAAGHRPGRRAPRAGPPPPARLRADDGRRIRPLGGDLAARWSRRLRLARGRALADPIAARRRVVARKRRAGHARRRDGRRTRAPAAERRRLLPARRRRAEAPRPARGATAAALDVSRVAGRTPGRRRDSRNLAARAAHGARRDMGAPVSPERATRSRPRRARCRFRASIAPSRSSGTGEHRRSRPAVVLPGAAPRRLARRGRDGDAAPRRGRGGAPVGRARRGGEARVAPDSGTADDAPRDARRAAGAVRGGRP